MTYRGSGLDLLDPNASPLEVLRSWFVDATRDHRVREPAAMVIATVDRDGVPNARTVLLKGLDERGFTFYTNTESTKAGELACSAVAALVMPWHDMFRQVRARGAVEPASRETAEAYFQSRPRGADGGAVRGVRGVAAARVLGWVSRAAVRDRAVGGHGIEVARPLGVAEPGRGPRPLGRRAPLARQPTSALTRIGCQASTDPAFSG
jgi:hypothetical protein